MNFTASESLINFFFKKRKNLNYINLFQIKAENGKVNITASSGVAVSWGLLYYLKNFCNAHVSWEADQLILPNPLPSADVTITAFDMLVHSMINLFFVYDSKC